MVSHPETGSDPPIGSDRESGRDRTSLPLSVFFIHVGCVHLLVAAISFVSVSRE